MVMFKNIKQINKSKCPGINKIGFPAVSFSVRVLVCANANAPAYRKPCRCYRVFALYLHTHTQRDTHTPPI